MSDQPAEEPAPLGFQFETNAPRVKCCLIKPGKIWNVTAAAWEDMPASGNPAAAHRLDPAQFSSAGAGSTIWNVPLPFGREELAGGGILVYAADASGNYQANIRYFGHEYTPEGGTTMYIDGGTFYLR